MSITKTDTMSLMIDVQTCYLASHTGIPEVVPVRTVNRQCSSGLQAIADVAAAIKAGFYTIGLAGGVETMSANPMAWEVSSGAAARAVCSA